MNETGIIRPWPTTALPRVTPRQPVAVTTEADERLLMARLFGRPVGPATNTTVPPVAGTDDEFAPNLGRHVDVIA